VQVSQVVWTKGIDRPRSLVTGQEFFVKPVAFRGPDTYILLV